MAKYEIGDKVLWQNNPATIVEKPGWKWVTVRDWYGNHKRAKLSEIRPRER